MNFSPDMIGYAAATLTTISFFPQAVQVIRTKDTAAISLHMYLLFNVGVWLWLFYGILLERTPIIIANAVTIILTSIILIMKLREKKRNRQNSSSSSKL